MIIILLILLIPVHWLLILLAPRGLRQQLHLLREAEARVVRHDVVPDVLHGLFAVITV